VAYYWMSQGYFARVLPIFQELMRLDPEFPGRTKTDVRLMLSAHTARAAGGAGDRSTFRRYWVEVLRLSKEPDAQSKASDALNELAQGASSLGEWDRAEQAAERALEIAQSRGEAAEVVRAEWILDSVRSGRQAEEKRVGGAPGVSRVSEALAEQFLNSLVTSEAGAGV
jgi:tetratricopeptide (TPR) repeat protein